MNVSSAHRSLSGTPVPLEQLSHNSHLSQPEKIAEASRQFEAVLVRQILTEAQKPVFQPKNGPMAVAGDIYRDMVTTQLADQISRSGSIGLAQSLENQLQHQLKPADKTPGTEKPGTASRPIQP